MSLRNQWQLIVCSCLLLLVGLIGVGTSEPTKVVMMSRSDYDYPKFDEQMLELFLKENPDIVLSNAWEYPHPSKE